MFGCQNAQAYGMVISVGKDPTTKGDEMPNWVSNSLSVMGDEADVARLKEQVGRKFSRTDAKHDLVDGVFAVVQSEEEVEKPFSFWNIIRPREDEMEKYNMIVGSGGLSSSDPAGWYMWNVNHWGVKWDAGSVDMEDYGAGHLQYRFDTPWGVPEPVLVELSRQFPTLSFELWFEEETGWGGEASIKAGSFTTTKEWNWRCNECEHTIEGEPNTYNEETGENVCPNCGDTY